MIKLNPANFDCVSSLFQQTKYGVLAAGTLEGGHPGHVFCDDPADPTAALVCKRVGYYFLAGRPNNSDFNRSLQECFE